MVRRPVLQGFGAFFPLPLCRDGGSDAADGIPMTRLAPRETPPPINHLRWFRIILYKYMFTFILPGRDA